MFLFQPEDITNLSQWIVWLAGGGAAVVAAGLVAYLAEHVPLWHSLPSWLKTIVPGVLSFLIAFAASEALNYTEVITVIQPFFALIITFILGWIGALNGHGFAKRSGVSARTKR